MMRLILLGAHKASDRALGSNWEGLYIIKENLDNGAYHLEDMNGVILPLAWNAEHLRPYFR